MSKVIQTSDKPRFRFNVDGLMNVYTGMGTGNSKSAHNRWANSGWMTGPMIDVIYRESWLAQRICSLPAKDGTRKWRRFTGEDAEKIEREEKRVGLKNHTELAKTYARAYGGAGVLMLTDQDLSKPLDLRKIEKGDLKKLLVLDRHDLTAPVMNIYNPLSDNYLRPEYYTLVNGSQRIHWSHVARFEGLPLPRRLAAIEHGWGDSDLRRVLQDINGTVAAFMGISDLMQNANVDVVQAEGLINDLTTGEDQKIIERYQLFNLMKSNYGLSLLDSNEELKRLTLQLSGVAQSMEQLLTWISGAAEIPMTRLFGTSAKGMNATGDGDERVYYDSVSSMQESDLRPPLQHIDQVLVRSALGKYPEDTDFDFVPLYQLDDNDQANVDYTNSQTDKDLYELRIVTRSQIARRWQGLDRYQITDEDIAKIEADEKVEEEARKAMEEEDDFNLDDPSNDPDGGDNGDESDSDAA